MASAVCENGGARDPSEYVFGRRNSIIRKLFERAMKADQMKDLLKQSNEYYEVCMGLINIGQLVDASKIAKKIQTEEIQLLVTKALQDLSPEKTGTFLPANRDIIKITKECEMRRNSLSSASSKYSSE